jgi:hypothetical protein
VLNGDARGVVTDSAGRFALSARTQRRVDVHARRIGFAPVTATVDFGDDTLVVLELRIAPLPTILEARTIETAAVKVRVLHTAGFYERMRDRHIGAGSGTFITPEEIELRRPREITQMLDGVAGVSVARDARGRGGIPMGRGRTCPMTVYVDGIRLQLAGTSTTEGAPGSFSQLMRGGGGGDGGPTLDEIVAANDVAAVEVYPRGGNAPPQFQLTNGTCGIVVIWTGARRSPPRSTPATPA